jgi:hypothetical protein
MEKDDDKFKEHAGSQATSGESEGCHMRDDLGASRTIRVLMDLIRELVQT